MYKDEIIAETVSRQIVFLKLTVVSFGDTISRKGRLYA